MTPRPKDSPGAWEKNPYMKRSWILLAAAPLTAMAALWLLTEGAAPRPAEGAQALRIVSLAPSATEMLFTLGLGESVVGVTDRCDFPPAAKRIDCVGEFGAPHVETLLALRPDLVVATNFRDKETPVMLRRAGPAVLELKIGTFGELYAAFAALGRATGTEQRAEKVVTDMRRDLAAIAKRYETIPPSRRPRVYVEIWGDPLITVGRSSFLHELITLAGGVNVAGALEIPYPSISPETIPAWNPDVILLFYEIPGADASPAAQVAGRIGWSEISAVRTGRIFASLPRDILQRPGPRLLEGVRALATLLHSATEGPPAKEARP
jgi:iron complex transport system substrate-binding protein